MMLIVIKLFMMIVVMTMIATVTMPHQKLHYFRFPFISTTIMWFDQFILPYLHRIYLVLYLSSPQILFSLPLPTCCLPSVYLINRSCHLYFRFIICSLFVYILRHIYGHARLNMFSELLPEDAFNMFRYFQLSSITRASVWLW